MPLVIEFGQQLLNGLVVGGIYAMMALGLTMIFGILDQVNFAHGEMYMLGAYATLFFAVSAGIPYPFAILLAMAAIAILGLLYEWLIFRPLRGTDPLNVIISSLGASIFLWNVALYLFGSTPRQLKIAFAEVVITLGGLSLTLQRLLVVVITLLLILILYFFIMRTRMGKAMRAMAQDREVASLMGVEINRVAEITFAIGGALAGAAGALIGPIFLIYPAMGLMAVQKAFAVVIVGGMGNVSGAIFAGFALGIVESLGAGFIASAYKHIIAFAILILALWLRPEGLFGRTARKGG
ncbi:MAG TPA: branched-chain amino acid ABC transporter permease [Anaerolineae bacterium]|nr:branched-chain amino acid ABC transporter permease [Anaerolineae bacterium]